MSDLLRPWLGRTIGQELGEVLQRWSKCEANGSQGTGQVEGLSFEDDGSNLRIRSPRPRVVQIIKVKRMASYEPNPCLPTGAFSL